MYVSQPIAMRIPLMILVTILGVLTTVLGVETTGHAAPDARPRVAVVNGVELPDLMDETRGKLRDVLEAGVTRHGFDLVRPAAATACAEKGCLKTLAAGAGATDVLVAKGGKNANRGYQVELLLWNPANDREEHAFAECNFCTGPQMVEAVEKAAGPLLDHLSAAPAGAAGATPPVLVQPPAAGGDDRGGGARRIVGWSLVGVGAAALVTGGVLVYMDGRQVDCGGKAGDVCPYSYDTKGQGFGFLLGGAVAGGVALWLLLDPLQESRVAFGVGPSGASISGRF